MMIMLLLCMIISSLYMHILQLRACISSSTSHRLNLRTSAPGVSESVHLNAHTVNHITTVTRWRHTGEDNPMGPNGVSARVIYPGLAIFR